MYRHAGGSARLDKHNAGIISAPRSECGPGRCFFFFLFFFFFFFFRQDPTSARVCLIGLSSRPASTD
jgi:hypothetical protein